MDTLSIIISSCFVALFIAALVVGARQHKWLIKNSPLDWDKYCNPSKIRIKTIKKSDNLNIIQETNDSFVSIIIYETDNGKWEYMYDYGITKTKGYFLKGNKVCYYDKESCSNNRSATYGSYNPD